MKSLRRGCVLGAWAVAWLGVLFAGDAVAAQKQKRGTQCRMDFEMRSWSIFYKSGKGAGTIFCDNGQKASVKIRAHGGGISFGKKKILDGRGTFSKVKDISNLYGGYAAAEAHAGVVKSAGAQALTKGDISLTLTGTGKGFDIGFDFGKLTLSPK